MMDGHALHRTEQAPRGPGMVRDSLRYAWGSRKIRRTLLLLTVIATIGFNFAVSLPLFAKFTFHGTPATLALLSGLTAVGGLIGALWCAARAHPTQALLAGTATAFGVFMIATAFAPTVLLAGLLLLGAGAASMAFISTANSTLQLTSPAHLRGRIMALYAIVLLGSTPFGGPLVGWISERWGARAGLWIGGAASLAAALVSLATVRSRHKTSEALADNQVRKSDSIPAQTA